MGEESLIKGYQKDMNTLPIKNGDIVLIKKGTQYHSMRDGKVHSAKKSYKVEVNHMINGAEWIDDETQYYSMRDGKVHSAKKIITNPSVSWAGTGGYWNRVDINDVILQNDFLTEKEMEL